MKIEQEYYYEKQSKAYKTEKECRLKSLCFIYITIDSKSNNYTVKDFHTFTAPCFKNRDLLFSSTKETKKYWCNLQQKL